MQNTINIRTLKLKDAQDPIVQQRLNEIHTFGKKTINLHIYNMLHFCASTVMLC